jgi:hypothetical protein
VATVRKTPGGLSINARAGRGVSFVMKVSKDLAGHTLSSAVTTLASRAQVGSVSATLLSPEAGKSRISVVLSPEQSSQLGVGTFSWSLTATPPTAGAHPIDLAAGFLELGP